MTFHISAKHEVIGVPARADVLQALPGARVVDYAGRPTALVPHAFHETKVLRQLGFPIPAPIMSQYHWPDEQGYMPFGVQFQTVSMLTTNQRAYVLNGMGTGKTKCGLWAFDFLRQKGQATRCLVVSPLSTLTKVWWKEAFQTMPHLSVCVLKGDKAKRLKLLAQEHDVYVINPDGVKMLHNEIKARPDIDTAIIDELATFRKATTDRSKILRKIVEKMVWAWGFTGSPCPKSPEDAYGQVKLLTPSRVPKTFGAWRDQTMIRLSEFKWKPKKDSMQQVYEAMQPSVRFSLDDVLELPECIERTIDVELGPRQKEIYEKLRDHAYGLVANKEVSAANAGVLFSKLLQVSTGYVYTKDGTVATLDNDLRLDVVVESIEQTERKVIVFVPFTHALKGISDRLKAEGIDHEIVDGSVAAGKRDRIFTAFQDTDKIKVIVAHPQCMAHGLTLTAADTIIWFGPLMDLEIFEQANARIRRIGQKHKQQILYLAGTAAEKKAYAQLRARSIYQSNLLNLFAENTEENQ